MHPKTPVLVMGKCLSENSKSLIRGDLLNLNVLCTFDRHRSRRQNRQAEAKWLVLVMDKCFSGVLSD